MTSKPQRIELAHDGSPINEEDFASLMQPIGPFDRDERIAIGVSGGPDSMALVRLASRWADRMGHAVVGLTVDHGLRDASSAEAGQVSLWLKELGVHHETLVWEAGPDVGLLDRSPQAAARQARFDLMTRWCSTEGVKTLLLAHHADDQIETFLQRLIRGSGLDGLSAMQVKSERDSICIVRPLLSYRKVDLLATCEAFEQPWIDDPSNADDRFSRVRVRNLFTALEQEGLSADRLLQTVQHLQRSKQAIDSAVNDLVAGSVSRDDAGAANVDVERLLKEPEEVVLRVLSRLLRDSAGAGYPPRFDNLKAVFDALVSERWSDRTLHGCQLRMIRGCLHIAPEQKNVGKQRVLEGYRYCFGNSIRPMRVLG